MRCNYDYLCHLFMCFVEWVKCRVSASNLKEQVAIFPITEKSPEEMTALTWPELPSLIHLDRRKHNFSIFSSIATFILLTCYTPNMSACIVTKVTCNSFHQTRVDVSNSEDLTKIFLDNGTCDSCGCNLILRSEKYNLLWHFNISWIPLTSV